VPRRSGDPLSSMGAGRRQWMPDMLASSPTCSVEGLMDDLA
jgi:hypothetical protein